MKTKSHCVAISLGDDVDVEDAFQKVVPTRERLSERVLIPALATTC
ncbi:hypothetical protein ACLB1Q_23235 [Escherichia coli]